MVDAPDRLGGFEVAVSTVSACGLLDEGQVRCWGDLQDAPEGEGFSTPRHNDEAAFLALQDPMDALVQANHELRAEKDTLEEARSAKTHHPGPGFGNTFPRRAVLGSIDAGISTA